MLAFLWLLSAPVAADDAEAALLEAARTAEARKDIVERDQWLRGWASLGEHRTLPKGLEGPAAAAQTFIQAQGGLEVYTSRMPDRLRVGVHDPAGIVFRIDAYAEVDGAPIRLTRLEGEASDRHDYRLPGGPSAPTLIVDVVAVIQKREIRLRRAIVAPATASLPAAPDPHRAARRIDPRRSPEPVVAVEAPALVQWWWIAGGALAVGLAGAAIWQETR